MKVLFVISSIFPYGEAYSSRARHLVKLFRECNYEVHVIAPGVKEECIQNDSYSYEYVLDNKTPLKLAGFGRATPYIKAIENYLKRNKVDILISSNIPFVTPKIIKLSKKNKIPCIIEQCEWFDSSSFKLKSWNPYYRETIKMIEHKNKKASGIIVISRLFEEYYKNQGINTVRIPTILDIKNIKVWYENNTKGNIINIIFAGSLGKGKENISPMIKAVNEINETCNNKFHLHFYGPDKKQIKKNVGAEVDIEKNYIHIYGKISQESVEDKLREADYSFIIRPNRRSSDAGFPTKLAESMAVGTPVIANNTGDIGLYITNGKNGYLIRNSSSIDIKKILQKILELKEEDKEKMRKEARKTAEKNFDYNRYKEIMREFFKNYEEY